MPFKRVRASQLASHPLPPAPRQQRWLQARRPLSNTSYEDA
jgi:hypothetical protein